MKRIFTLLAIIIAIASCNNPTKPKTEAKDFGNFKEQFIEDLWKQYPGFATGVGYHKYDSALVIPDASSNRASLAFVDEVEKGLKAFDFEKLSDNDKTDYKLIQSFIDGTRFGINEFKSNEWDPSNYNVGGSFFSVIDNKEETLDNKLKTISIKLSKVPAFYAAAKANINKPTREHTDLAIKQNEGSLYIFNQILADSLNASNLTADEKAKFKQNSDSAVAAINGYVAFLTDLKSKFTDDNTRSFRIGKELYAKKFAFDIESRYTSAEMYQKAMDRKAYLHGEMTKISRELWPKHMGKQPMPADSLVMIKALVDKISLQHCKAEEFTPTIEKQLSELRTFINSKSIIDLDSTKPLEVRETPAYMAGVAGASISGPGPYEKNATTYYNVTPLIKPTNKAEADKNESYLREYNDYVLQILNIHEAIPGHYTQGIYSNRSPSIIKTIFGNGAMIEGWACYVERMMLEEGYNNSPEMWLFYYKWNLREACNFLLDYNIQCNDWSAEQVRNLLVNEAFQQSAEADEKYKRATLTQVQLTSYFTGLTEIYELREELKAKQGKAFDLKKFHEQFLSYGSAPVKEIRELMLHAN
jgi:uncharacterized protein (DUF885 family)